MRTYTTLDRAVFDLSDLGAGGEAFLERCLAGYREGLGWYAFTNLIFSPENPLLAPGSSRRSYDAPLMRALRDLCDRTGIREGLLRPEACDDIAADPFADDFLTVAAAAAESGVSRMAVHKAIVRGDLVATSGRPTKVSRRSLDAWRIDATRQKAGRVRKAAPGHGHGTGREPATRARTA